MSASSAPRRAISPSDLDERRAVLGQKRPYGLNGPPMPPFVPRARLAVGTGFISGFDPVTTIQPQKFGFFDQALPSISAGHVKEKRSEPPNKVDIAKEGVPIVTENVRASVPIATRSPIIEEPRMIQPPSLNGSNTSSVGPVDTKPVHTIQPTAEEDAINGAINELFAKMVWKKLDLIKDPLRLSRLHTEIMNVLQQAVAEEGTNNVE